MISSMLISLDMEKAFDSLEWIYLIEVLSKYGLQGSFMKVIKGLYNNPSAQIVTSGMVSDNIKIERGTRQGDPLSPLLFILAVEPLVESIRKNTNIRGIKIGDNEYKTLLFADDIMLNLAEPEISLPPLFEILQNFSKISGLKCNQDKSEALNISIPDKQLNEIQSRFPFKWAEESITYLGINLTTSYNTLYKNNYPKLFSFLKAEMTSWKKMNISWVGRINTIKMNILPKTLYFFRSLPIPIPSRDILDLQKSINRFIWGHKKARIKQSIMYKHRFRGGLGVPNMLKYLETAHLAQLLTWNKTNEIPAWVDIEDSQTKGCYMQYRMWLLKPLMNIETVLQSVKIWKKIRHKYNLSHKKSIMTPLFNNPIFPMGQEVDRFEKWIELGINRVKHLFREGKLMGFMELQEKYNLENSEIFKYIQLKHFVQTLSFTSNEIQGTSFERAVVSLISNKGTISRLYGEYLNITEIQKQKYQLDWEKDLGKELTEEEWSGIWMNTTKSSINVALTETSLKLLHRAYLTPDRVAHFKPNCSSMCFRGCQVKGTMLHIWWQCPVVNKIWNRISKLISNIMSKNIEIDSWTALLNKNNSNLTKDGNSLIRKILSATRIHIAAQWYKPKLHFNSIVSKINNIWVNERLTAILSDRLFQTEKIWEPWLSSPYKIQICFQAS